MKAPGFFKALLFIAALCATQTAMAQATTPKTPPWWQRISSAEALSEWTLTGSAAFSSNYYGYLTVPASSTARLPEFEALEEAASLFVINDNSSFSNQVWVSPDGSDWTQLTRLKNAPIVTLNTLQSCGSGYINSFTLPVGTKFVEIRNAGTAQISEIAVTYSSEFIYTHYSDCSAYKGVRLLSNAGATGDAPDSLLSITAEPVVNGSFNFETSENSYVLSGTPSTGAEAVLQLPNTKLPRFYKGQLYLYFKLANYDKSKIKLYFNETEIKANNGDVTMPLDSILRANSLRAVSTGGQSSSLEISDLRIMLRRSTQIQTNADYWFKNGETLGYTIGDGTFGKNNGWWFLESKTDNTYIQKIPYNLNNDDTQDFYSKSSEYMDRGPAIVFVNDREESLPEGIIGPVDYNQDGLTDFLYENFVMQQVADGSFKKIPLTIMTVEEYIKRQEEFSVAAARKTGGNGLGPMAYAGGAGFAASMGSLITFYGLFTISLINSESAPPLTTFDFDGNGGIDILNNSSGLLMLNMGNGEYATTQMGGTIFFRDLNGDNLLDYVVYASDGKIVVGIAKNDSYNTANPFTYTSLDDIWFSDFDGDGHIDIILPISSDGNYAYMVILKNDGAGNFDVIENDYTAKLQFTAMADLNGDGVPDVVAIDNATSNVVWLKGNKSSYNFDLQSTPLYDFSKNYYGAPYASPGTDKFGRPKSMMNANAADVNQDGFYDLILNYAYQPAGANGQQATISEAIPVYTIIEDAVPNTPPNPPDAPTFAFDPASGFLKINWGFGNDAENSPVDLTYELCIGTSDGRCDIYGANADAITGKRFNLQNGNMSYKRDALLNASSWNSGDYYIRIQAIDPAKSGSAWSEATVFAKNALPASFAASGEKNVIDNLELSLTAPYDASLTYNWNLDGAEEISDVNGVKTIKFSTPGLKKLTLQTEKAGEKSQIFEQEIYIAANKFTVDGDFNGGYGNSDPRAYAYIDFKAEGILAATTSDKLYQNDGTGKFTRASGTFQNNISFSIGDVFADYNSDGLVDVLNYSGSQLNVYVNNYAAGANFSFANTGMATAIPLPASFTSSCSAIDLNGDSKPDILCGATAYINNGDYQSYTSVQTGISSSQSTYVDFDSDGILDVIGYNYTTSPYNLTFYKGKGNGTFEAGIVLENSGNSLYTNVTDGGRVEYFIWADMNNDGYPDAVTHYKERSVGSGEKITQNVIRIFYNNGGKGFNADVKNIKLALTGHSGSFQTDKLAFAYDFDNNGYLDLYINGTSTYKIPSTILYFDSSLDPVAVAVPYLPSGAIADLNGDGVEDVSRFINNSTVVNTPPNPPANVRYTQTDTTLLIEWDAATDTESPRQSLRYNVSVKKSGTTGAGSYIISPLNKTANGVRPVAIIAAPYNPYYRSGTRLEIPLSKLDAGNYDIQIQSLDLWNAPSTFSEAVTAKVTNDPQIRVPAAICAGTPATIRYLGIGTPSWNWNGGVLASSNGNEYSVTWSTEGSKTVSVNSGAGTADLLVMPPIDTEITLPSQVFPNAEISFDLPGNGLLDYEFSNKNGSESDIDIYRKSGRETAYAVFKAPGTYTIAFTVNAPCGTASKDYTIEVPNVPKAQISLVTADGGNAKINWEVPVSLPPIVQKVNVYREGSKYNSFDLIASIPATGGFYTDPSSNTNITSNRYRIAYASGDGYESERSDIHKNLHLMINKGIGSAWNLFWGVYEGAIVETFYVLRGTTPDNLEIIGSIPGSTASFSDLTPPEGDLYYAIGYDTPYQPENNAVQSFFAPISRLFSALKAKFSSEVSLPGATNVVSTQSASIAVLATSLNIREVAPLTPEHYFEVLSTIIEPSNATYKNVHWSITEGEGYASIQNGILIINPGTTGSGTITIKAETIDGSGKSVTKSVEYDMPEPPPSSSSSVDEPSSSSVDEPSSSSVDEPSSSSAGTPSSSSAGTPSSSSAGTPSSSSAGTSSSSSSSGSGTPSSSSGGTPIRLPQIATANQATQIYNGVNLQARSSVVVEVYGLNGNLVSRQNFGSGVYTVSFGHLPKGVYIVKASFGNEKQILRMPVR